MRGSVRFFFFNDTATTEIYTLSLHDALPISDSARRAHGAARQAGGCGGARTAAAPQRGVPQDHHRRDARRARGGESQAGAAPREGSPGGVKLLPLVLANLRRHKLRTLLTMLGV